MKHSIESHKIIESSTRPNLELVVLETRYVSEDIATMIKYRKFTLACIRDCLKRGEAPYASHMLFTETNALGEFSPDERAIGMHSGFLWGSNAVKTVVYTDLGLGLGMQQGIKSAQEVGRSVEYRELGWIPSVTASEVEFEIQLRSVKKKMFEEIVGFSGELAMSEVSNATKLSSPTLRSGIKP